MAHLVTEHRADLRQRGLVEEIVVQVDSRDVAETGHVGADARGLFRGIEPFEVIGGNLVCPRERQDGLAHGPLGQGLVIVEQRGDEHRVDEIQEQREDESEARRPDPPAVSSAAKTRVEDRQHDRPDDERHGQADRLLAQPAREAQVRQAILVLAYEASIDRQRQVQHERGENEKSTIDRDGKPRPAAHAFRKIAHAPAQTGP